jgi:hypothetical protein
MGGGGGAVATAPEDERERSGGGGGDSVGRGGRRWGKRGMMTVMPVREG